MGMWLDQMMDQITGHGPIVQVLLCQRGLHGWQMIQTPAKFACSIVRRQKQASDGSNLLGMGLQSANLGGTPSVLPTDDGADGLTITTVPTNDIGTLGSQTGRFDVMLFGAEFFEYRTQWHLDGLQ